MTLELLISTIGDRLRELEHRLLPPRPDVRYLISWQSTESQPELPEWALLRGDVQLYILSGQGLCRNRNNALSHATGDILKICDDDEVWTNEDFDTILSTYQQHPEYDIVHFQALGLQKDYPPYYVSSVEITMRGGLSSRLRFDEHFGLGSPCLCAGEEEVFLHDARKAGYMVNYVPRPICETSGNTTGQRKDSIFWRSKGAVFYRTGPNLLRAYYHAFCESSVFALHSHVCPLPILREMIWGIKYIRSCHR